MVLFGLSIGIVLMGRGSIATTVTVN